MEKSYVADGELMKALEKRSKPVTCSDERILFRQGEFPTGLYILRRRASDYVAQIDTLIAIDNARRQLLAILDSDAVSLSPRLAGR